MYSKLEFSILRRTLYVAFASCFLFLSDISHGFAQSEKLDELFLQLQDEEIAEYSTIEDNIWKEWRKSGSDSVDFLLERGMLAMNRGQLTLAIKHFTTVIEQAPEFAEGYNMRATAYYLIQRFGLSVADIEKTLALNPRHFGAMSGLGLIFEQTGREKEALSVYYKVLELHPKSEQANMAKERLEAELEGTAL